MVIYMVRFHLAATSWPKVVALGILLALEPVLAELYKILTAETPTWPNEYQIAGFAVLAALQLVTFFIAFLRKD